MTTPFITHFQKNEQALQNFAFKLVKDKNRANDLVQETAIKAYRGYHTFKEGTSFKSWSFTILKNTFISLYHKRKRRAVVNQPLEDFSFALENKQSVGNSGEARLQHEDVRLALERLSDTSKIPFLMHVEGYQYNEIAEHLDIPIGTVKSRINYARTKMKQFLASYRLK